MVPTAKPRSEIVGANLRVRPKINVSIRALCANLTRI